MPQKKALLVILPKHLFLAFIHVHCFNVGIPSGAVVKNLPANAGDLRDTGSVPGLGSSPGEGNGNPFQYSYLENSTDSRAQGTVVHRVAKSQTQLKQLHTHVHCFHDVCWGTPEAALLFTVQVGRASHIGAGITEIRNIHFGKC